MTDEINDVEAGDPLLVQVVHRVRVLLTKNRHQHVRPGDFLLAVGRALNMHDRALNHPLKAKGGLRVDLLSPRYNGRVFPNELGQVLAQVVEIGCARAQNLGCGRVIKQCEQEVLDRNKFVTLLACLNERHVEADFQFLRNHASSITHCSGCWCWRAKLQTWSTLVAARSRGYTPQTPRPAR